MNYAPRKHQKLITKFILEKKHCNIWAGMGMGKTAAVLAALQALKVVEGDAAARTLVVAPKRVVESVWPAQAKQWEDFKDLSIVRIDPPTKPAAEPQDLKRREVWERREAVKKVAARAWVKGFTDNPVADIYLVSFDDFAWVTHLLHTKWPFPVVVIDESSKLKAHSTQLFKAARKISLLADYWVNLTGTPASNTLMDLWTQMYLLDGGERLGRTLTSYRGRFFKQDYNGFSWVLNKGADEKIQTLVADVTLSIRSQDYMPVDDYIVNDVFVDMPDGLGKDYKRLVADMALTLEGSEVLVANAAVLSGKCRQFASGAVYADDGSWEPIHSAKIDALRDILETMETPVLLAYDFQHERARIMMAFPQAREYSAEIEADWNAGKIPLMIGHPASIGHGLNLQDGGCNVVWFGLTWSLELYEQFNARVGPVRQMQAGHPRPVFIHRILMRGTVDEAQALRLETKASVQDALIQYVNNYQRGV